MNDYPDGAWLNFLDNPLNSGAIQSAVREAAINRQNARNAGDTDTVATMSDRLVQLTAANARVQGAGQAASAAEVRDSAVSEADVASLGGFFASATNRIVTIGVVALVVYIVARKQGWLK